MASGYEVSSGVRQPFRNAVRRGAHMEGHARYRARTKIMKG